VHDPPPGVAVADHESVAPRGFTFGEKFTSRVPGIVCVPLLLVVEWIRK
jgi:hypothetical protein